jgi:hypothetical protein
MSDICIQPVVNSESVIHSIPSKEEESQILLSFAGMKEMQWAIQGAFADVVENNPSISILAECIEKNIPVSEWPGEIDFYINDGIIYAGIYRVTSSGYPFYDLYLYNAREQRWQPAHNENMQSGLWGSLRKDFVQSMIDELSKKL